MMEDFYYSASSRYSAAASMEEAATPPTSAAQSSSSQFHYPLYQQQQRPTTTTSTTTTTMNDISELPALRTRVRNYVDQVIRATIDASQAAAYLEAVQKCPDLVLTETDPIQFVRFCRYDLWAGASQLCNYWTERKKLFGAHRAFLPLILSGNGALTDEDIHTLHAGYPAILPDTKTARKCMLVDRNHWIPSATDENKLRALFYVLCVLSAYDSAQTEGVIALIVLTSPRDREINWTYGRKITTVGSVFPVRFQAHFINIPSRRKWTVAATATRAVEDLVGRLWKPVLGIGGNSSKYFRPDLHFHFQTEPDEILHKLMTLGLEKEDIPLQLGGQWNIENWYRWCQKRKIWEETQQMSFSNNDGDEEKKSFLERNDKTHAKKKNIQNGFDFSNNSATVDNYEKRPSRTAQPPRNPPNTSNHQYENNSNNSSSGRGKRKSRNDDQHQTRMESILRSRRERQRRRTEFEALKKGSAQLTTENCQLQKERQILEQLLQRANELVETFIHYQ